MKNYQYKVFGLSFDSELELPGLIPTKTKEPDVNISLGKVPKQLSNVQGNGVLFESAPGKLLLTLPKIGSYYIKNGNTIIVEPNDNVSPEEIRLFLLGSSIAALLHQRGTLTIHASAVSKGSMAYLFTGISSAGKSSLAAGFLSKGFQLVSDDISVLAPSSNGNYIIQPGIPHLKLWKDVVDHFDYTAQLERVRPKIEKYKWSNGLNITKKPKIVKCIIVLSVKTSKGINIKKVSGSDKFALLYKNTFRGQYIKGLGQTKNHFANITELANAVEIYSLERPISPIHINEIVNTIEGRIGNI